MNTPESKIVSLCADPDFFRSAVSFTAKTTGFVPRLIEKDYFCTILLEYFGRANETLVFKGGTCLAKVHANFYRLSEDLDFVVPLPTDASRSERSSGMAGLKQSFARLPRQLPFVRIVQALTGANGSRQYIGVVGYASFLSGREETVKIEVGLREPLLLATMAGPAQTLLLDPNADGPLIAPITVRCICQKEAFAEKFRAALSRREAAIRDFHDIDYAVRRLSLHPTDAGLVTLIRRKLAVPGNAPVDVSKQRLDALRQQVEAQLKPVLRPGDFADFDLDRAFGIVSEIAAKVAKAL